MGEPLGSHLADFCVICKLRSGNFFCNLRAPVRQAFAKITRAVRHPAGAVLFMEGESPHGIHVLCSGDVMLSLTSSTGRRVIMKQCGTGDVLGLHACISGAAHDFTAETTQPCEAKFARRDDFLAFLRQDGSACLQVAEYLSAEHQSALQVIRNIALSHTCAEKLAHLLLEQSTAGTETSEGIRFAMNLSHQEMGERIGASRETVSRLLAEFTKRKIIEKRKHSLLVRDNAALRRMARL